MPCGLAFAADKLQQVMARYSIKFPWDEVALHIGPNVTGKINVLRNEK